MVRGGFIGIYGEWFGHRFGSRVSIIGLNIGDSGGKITNESVFLACALILLMRHMYHPLPIYIFSNVNNFTSIAPINVFKLQDLSDRSES